MSRENVESLLPAYEAVNARSEPNLELFDPDFELDANDLVETTVV